TKALHESTSRKHSTKALHESTPRKIYILLKEEKGGKSKKMTNFAVVILKTNGKVCLAKRLISAAERN
ncbi:MAG: hypothetical protein IJ546_02655, partial [Prevotella sp.]|nr:hypothetical protein [Prevotella sp.]